MHEKHNHIHLPCFLLVWWWYSLYCLCKLMILSSAETKYLGYCKTSFQPPPKYWRGSRFEGHHLLLSFKNHIHTTVQCEVLLALATYLAVLCLFIVIDISVFWPCLVLSFSALWITLIVVLVSWTLPVFPIVFFASCFELCAIGFFYLINSANGFNTVCFGGFITVTLVRIRVRVVFMFSGIVAEIQFSRTHFTTSCR